MGSAICVPRDQEHTLCQSDDDSRRSIDDEIYWNDSWQDTNQSYRKIQNRVDERLSFDSKYFVEQHILSRQECARAFLTMKPKV